MTWSADLNLFGITTNEDLYVFKILKNGYEEAKELSDEIKSQTGLKKPFNLELLDNDLASRPSLELTLRK